METKSDETLTLSQFNLHCDMIRSANSVMRRGLTLVEVLVVIAIVGILFALFVPHTRMAREAARRNQCISNLKHLTFAILNHYDARNSLPLASTAPLIQANAVQQYGAVGGALADAESPTSWPGQEGDGYSWIAQCLPFMEEGALYEKMTATQGGEVVRLGKLKDAAFTPSSNLSLAATGNDASPYFWSTKIPAFICPTFPGEDDVGAFGSIPASHVATGNYVALSATHYRVSPKDHLESGLPGAAGIDAGGKDCTHATYCGNGGMPFPGVVGGKVQRIGLGMQAFSKGTSKVALISESREESLTSWYSGLASYVVALMPPPNGANPAGKETQPGQFFWTCEGVANCDYALNKGDQKHENSSKYYQPVSPHGGGARIWGPSSRHPGVVNHGFGDGHVESVSDQIDKDVYLNLALRAGEVDVYQ